MGCKGAFITRTCYHDGRSEIKGNIKAPDGMGVEVEVADEVVAEAVVGVVAAVVGDTVRKIVIVRLQI